MSFPLSSIKLRSRNLRQPKHSEEIFFSIKLLLLIPFNLAKSTAVLACFYKGNHHLVPARIYQRVYPSPEKAFCATLAKFHFIWRQTYFFVIFVIFVYQQKQELWGLWNSEARYTIL